MCNPAERLESEKERWEQAGTVKNCTFKGGRRVQKTVAVNERGLRIGEDHQNARYTNGEIEMVLTLRDDGKSYGEIARLVEMPKSTVRDICTGRRRCQYPADFKTVRVPDGQ